MNDLWYEQVEISIKELKEGLHENTILTEQIQKNTEGVVSAFQAASGAFKTLEVLGKLTKPVLWLALVGTIFTTIWSNFKQVFTFLGK